MPDKPKADKGDSSLVKQARKARASTGNQATHKSNPSRVTTADEKELLTILIAAVPSTVRVPSTIIREAMVQFLDGYEAPTPNTISIYARENAREIEELRKNPAKLIQRAIAFGLFPLLNPYNRVIELHALYHQAKEGYTQEKVFADGSSSEYTVRDSRVDAAKILQFIRDEADRLVPLTQGDVVVDVNFADDTPPPDDEVTIDV